MNLKNPFIMAPVKLGYSDTSGEVKEKHIEFYSLRSKEIGAVIPEPLYLDKGLREIPTQLGIDNDDKIPGLKKLTDAIHKKGAQVIAHLNHPGRMANPKIPGNFFMSSTDKPCENGGAAPKAITEQDMDEIKNLFKSAVIRAKKAGFDIIELQLGHGYLAAQFLSPAVNDRTDMYGGSLENRMRFPLEIFDAVKQASDLPVIIRMSADELIPNGIKPDEAVIFAKALEQRGAEAIHIVAGTVCSTPPWFFQHMFIPKGKTWDLAAAIKKEVNIPVIFVGRVNSKQDADKLINEYKADYVALGRALVADPGFISKYLGKIDENIRPCLACSEGCLGGVKSGKGLGCVINPLAGKEYKKVEPAKEKKKYCVVGGGLAGMEAAITLKKRGHNVVIFEKDNLGGQFNLAWLPPAKGSLKEIIDFYIAELKRMGIDVINKEASKDDLLNSGFSGVILATGAEPVSPPIKGLSDYVWAEILYDKNMPKGEKVVVVGGGLIGIEIASKLVDNNNDVTIVEMLDEIARGMEMIERALTLKKLKSKNVKIYTGTKVEEIDGKNVYVKGEKDSVLEGIDKIVIATGMKSYHPLEEELKGKIPVYIIGDAKEVGKAQEAIFDGFTNALEL